MVLYYYIIFRQVEDVLRYIIYQDKYLSKIYFYIYI